MQWKLPAAALAGASALVFAIAVPLRAEAQSAGRPPAELTIINDRAAPLTTFEIATTGSQPRLVAKLSKPLAPGQSVRVTLNRPTGCAFFVLARFEDGSDNDAEDINLCGETEIRLTD